jgi:hypothetical protein
MRGKRRIRASCCVTDDPKGTLVFSRSSTLRILHIALFSAILGACSNDDPPAQTSTSAATEPAAPSVQPQSSAAVDSSSDVQRWAALQTQPAATAQQAAPAPASDALLPPVIHTVD